MSAGTKHQPIADSWVVQQNQLPPSDNRLFTDLGLGCQYCFIFQEIHSLTTLVISWMILITGANVSKSDFAALNSRFSFPPQDESRVKVTVIEVQPVDHREYSRRLLSNIRKLTRWTWPWSTAWRLNVSSTGLWLVSDFFQQRDNSISDWGSRGAASDSSEQMAAKQRTDI